MEIIYLSLPISGIEPARVGSNGYVLLKELVKSSVSIYVNTRVNLDPSTSI